MREHSRLAVYAAVAALFAYLHASLAASAVQLHGINYVYFSPWWLETALWETRAGVIQAELDAMRLKSLGFNLVQVPIYLYQENTTSSNPRVDTLHYGLDYLDIGGPLAKLIKVFEKTGFRVCLYVRVNVGDGTWCALIKPRNVTQWFESYAEALEEIAVFAKRVGVDCLMIAAELDSLSGRHYDRLWSGVVERVRRVYDGVIVYSFPYKLFKEGFNMWETAKAVDVIASNIYEGVGEPDSSVDEVYERWLKLLEPLVEVAEALGKPAYIAETGCRSVYGSIERPWQAWFDDIVKPIPDYREQLTFYRAFLRAVDALNETLLGYSLWAATPGLGASWYTYEFTGHPTEQVIAEAQGGRIPMDVRLVVEAGGCSHPHLYYDFGLFEPKGLPLLNASKRIMLNVTLEVLEARLREPLNLAELELRVGREKVHLLIALVNETGVCHAVWKTSYNDWRIHSTHLPFCTGSFNVTLGAYLDVDSGTWRLYWRIEAEGKSVEATLNTSIRAGSDARVLYFELEPFEEPARDSYARIAYDRLTLTVDNVTVANIDFGYTLLAPLRIIDLSTGCAKLQFSKSAPTEREQATSTHAATETTSIETSNVHKTDTTAHTREPSSQNTRKATVYILALLLLMLLLIILAVAQSA